LGVEVVDVRLLQLHAAAEIALMKPAATHREHLVGQI
jgi:hypothetical protein